MTDEITNPATSPAIDLNVDLGEGFGAWRAGSDEQLLTFVTTANIACGFHAGDPRVMDRTAGMAVRAGVAIGAHPGHWDLRGFGRRAIRASAEEIETDVVYQVGALRAFARSHGADVVQVKPHGALYDQAAREPEVARAVARGIARVDPGLRFVGLPASRAMRNAAAAEHLDFVAEGFVDRAYDADGFLASRQIEGGVILDPKKAAAQAERIVFERRAPVLGGGRVTVEAQTLCLHGDNPNAAEIAWAVRQALEQAGVALRAVP